MYNVTLRLIGFLPLDIFQSEDPGLVSSNFENIGKLVLLLLSLAKHFTISGPTKPEIDGICVVQKR